MTMITELAPAPKMFLFMSLFNTVGVSSVSRFNALSRDRGRKADRTQETSSFIGPFVTSAIVDRAGGNTYAAFYFLFPLALISLTIVCFVNPRKAKLDVARCKSSICLSEIQ